MNKRLETLEEKFEGNMKYSHVGLSEKDNINCIRNEKVRLGMKHNSRYQFGMSLVARSLNRMGE